MKPDLIFNIFKRTGKKSILFPLLYMIFIFILSSIPGDDSTRFSKFFEQINPGVQNLLHIPLFAGLAALWFFCLLNYNIVWKKVLFHSFIISWGYSLLDEFHQYFVPGRYPGFIDIILNTIGVIIMLSIFFRSRGKFNENLVFSPSPAISSKQIR